MMKKDSEILGLPVLCVDSGIELGRVEKLVIDKKTFKLAALGVVTDKWYDDVKLVDFTDVIGVGEDLITIESTEKGKTYKEYPNFNTLLDNAVDFIDSEIITKNGMVLGEVVSFTVSENGNITEFEYINEQEEIVVMTADRLYSMGRSITVVNE